MTTSIHEAQARFYHRYLAAARAITGALPLAEVDPEASSPCVVGDADERGMVAWQPVARSDEGDVSALERALGDRLHPDTHAWLARWYSLPIEATWGDETVVLLGAANDLELARFVEAAARFATEQRRIGAGGVPVAVLHDGRRVTVENTSGAVHLEVPGSAPMRIAPTLGDFLDAVEPLPL